MNRRLFVFVAAGLGLLGLAMIQARAVGPVPSRSAAPAAPEKLVAAEGQVVTYPGAQVTVGVERSGRLVRVLFEEGQRVKAGDLLAEIDSDELRATVSEGRAKVAECEAEVTLAEATLKRRQDLAAKQILSPHDLDQATRDLDTALARRETARATLSREEAQLRKSFVLSPISGSILSRYVDAGQTVESGNRVAALADLSRVRIEGEADEADAGSIHLGAPVKITAEGYPGKNWKGTVEEIPDSVTLRRLKSQDPGRPSDTRILAVKVAFSEPTPLKLGTTVELEIRPEN